jgi:hypothetical protein
MWWCWESRIVLVVVLDGPVEHEYEDDDEDDGKRQ